MEKILLNGKDWKMKEFLGMDWVWRNSVDVDTKDTRWWNNASVPGSVLHDLLEDGMVPDPYFELNSKLVEWVPARTWVYRKSFMASENWSGKKISLCFEGIDYEGEIFLNGVSLGHHKGMYIPWKADVTKHLLIGKENLLAVVIEPAPMEQPQVGKTSLVYTHKSRMTYWWDFCPRMIHQGIWDDVYLKVTEAATLEDVHISSDLSVNNQTASITVEVEAIGDEESKAHIKFGNLMKEVGIKKGKAKAEFIIHNPNLWWPNGYGEQYQYPVVVTLYDAKGRVSDCSSKKFGIRKIRFESNEGAPKEAPKFVLYVNGRRIYMNGYNWVPIDAMYGVERPKKLERLITLAKEAHTNIFRVWGGGLIEKESFYEKCAENGILVWQEFILSSSGIDNKTSEKEEYHTMMREQARVIIKRKRNHTALAIWCGGNELQANDGTPLDNTDTLLSILKQEVEELDPGRRWLPTSPSGGVFLNSVENIVNYPDKLYDVHGPWEHQGLESHCKLYNMGTSLLHTEFGVEGMTNRSTLKRSVAKEHLLPASKDNEIYFHRGAWWNNEPLVQETFGGNLTDIDEIRKASQFMQYEGLKYAVECNRRRAFANSGTFPWQFNEPFPNNYCTSHVDYYGNPKPIYYGMKKAYAPVAITASFASPSVAGLEQFVADIHLGTQYNQEEADNIGAITIGVELIANDGTVFYEERIESKAAVNDSKNISTILYAVKNIPTKLYLLRLYARCKHDILAENEYLFTTERDFSEIFKVEKPELRVEEIEQGIALTNQGNTIAYFVNISEVEQDTNADFVYLSENYSCILPGEDKVIHVLSEKTQNAWMNLAVEGLNVTYRIL